MAYDVSKEKELKVKSIKKNNKGEYIQIKRILNEKDNSESIDIRTMYTTEDGEIAPTKKGVRLNSELAVDVIANLFSCLSTEEISDIVSEINSKNLGYNLTYDLAD